MGTIALNNQRGVCISLVTTKPLTKPRSGIDIQQELYPSLQPQYAVWTVPISALMSFQHEWALKSREKGDAPTKETKKSFVWRPWADRASQHLKVVINLSEKKWQEIYKAT